LTTAVSRSPASPERGVAAPGHRIASVSARSRVETRSLVKPETMPAVRGSPGGNLCHCGSMDLAPRRGFPHPLRSAFAVSHDLDGLLLSEPFGVFQPVTLVEYGFR
jgi:hypothetical protein